MRFFIFAALALASQSTRAESVSFRGFSFDNSKIYDFIVEPGNSANRWDSAAKAPPISSKEANTSASDYMKKIEVREGWEWHRSKTRRHQVSKKPEEWIYVVSFVARLKDPKSGYGGFGTGIPRFDVVVQMDGRVPEPRIQDFGNRKKGTGVPNQIG